MKTIDQLPRALGASITLCQLFDRNRIRERDSFPGERYRDDREKAKELWAEIMLALEEVGALPQGTALAA